MVSGESVPGRGHERLTATRRRVITVTVSPCATSIAQIVTAHAAGAPRMRMFTAE